MLIINVWYQFQNYLILQESPNNDRNILATLVTRKKAVVAQHFFPLLYCVEAYLARPPSCHAIVPHHPPPPTYGDFNCIFSGKPILLMRFRRKVLFQFRVVTSATDREKNHLSIHHCVVG